MVRKRRPRRSSWHLVWYPIVLFALANLAFQLTASTRQVNLLEEAQPVFLVFALAAQLAAFGVLVPVMRWFYRRAGIKLHPWHTFDLIVAGLGFAKVVPAGEYLLWRNRLRHNKNGAGITTQFMVLLYSAMAVSLIGLFLSAELLTLAFYPNHQTASLIGKFAYLPLAAGAIVVALAFVLRLAEVRGWLGKMAARLLGSTVLSPLGIIREHAISRPELASVAAATIGNWLLEASTLWLCLAAMGQEPPFILCLFGYTFARIFQMVPVVPGGVGENEALTTLFFVSYGFAAGPVLTGTIIFRLISYWLPILVGSLTYMSIKKRPHLAA